MGVPRVTPEPDLSALTGAQAAFVRAYGVVRGAIRVSQVSRQRAAALSSTPCAQWAHLHLYAARQCLDLVDDVWPSLHEALRAALLEQRTDSYADARLWAEISAKLEAERATYLTGVTDASPPTIA